MSNTEKKEAGSTQGDISEEIQTTEKAQPRKREYKDFEHEAVKATRVYLFPSSCAPGRRSSYFPLPRLQTPMLICPR